MLLRHDDPLVAPLQAARRAGVSARQQSDRRAHREADLRQGARAGAAGRARHGLGNADVVCRIPRLSNASRSRVSSADVQPRDRFRSSSSISTARWSTRGATSPTRPTRCSSRAARRRFPKTTSAGWSATARRRSSRARSTASGIERPPDALERFLAIYDERLLNHTRPYHGHPGGARGARPRARRSPCSPTSRSPRRGGFSTGSISRAIFRRTRCSAATARCRASRIRRRCGISIARRRRRRRIDAAGRRFGHRLADGAGGRDARVSGAIRIRIRQRFRCTNWRRTTASIDAPARAAEAVTNLYARSSAYCRASMQPAFVPYQMPGECWHRHC